MKPTGSLPQNDGVSVMRPFRRRRQMLLAGAGVLVVGIAALTALFLLILPASAPQKLSIGATAAASTSPLTSGQAAGEWTVAKNSVAGYRVREQLAFVGAPSDAVGRTSAITGSMTMTQAGTTYMVKAATFTVDVSTLTSDRATRDRRIHSIGLQSDQYPKATFTLTSPISVPAAASNGQLVNLSAVGDLTLHGVTKSVTIPVTAKLNGAQIEVAGSITFPFSQFNMTPPNIGGFVSVQNDATMEFDLLFQRAGRG